MPLSRQSTSDRTWVARIRAGDADALDSVFRSYYAELCAFALRYVRSRAQAEDLVHDVFTRLWAEREQWQLRDSLQAYLYGAVRNRAISTLRRQIVERRWEDRVHATHVAAPAYAEIAETMGISVNTVEVHITRACRAVRERYAALQSDQPS